MTENCKESDAWISAHQIPVTHSLSLISKRQESDSLYYSYLHASPLIFKSFLSLKEMHDVKSVNASTFND